MLIYYSDTFSEIIKDKKIHFLFSKNNENYV